MDVLLNFAWMVVSLALLGWQIRAMRVRDGRVEWRVVIALSLLLAMLFPVISITDDLMAMTGAADVEHILRRPLEPIHPAPALPLTELITAAALLLFGLRQQRTMERVAESGSSLIRHSLGLTRVSSVRPPPADLPRRFAA